MSYAQSKRIHRLFISQQLRQEVHAGQEAHRMCLLVTSRSELLVPIVEKGRRVAVIEQARKARVLLLCFAIFCHNYASLRFQFDVTSLTFLFQSSCRPIEVGEAQNL